MDYPHYAPSHFHNLTVPSSLGYRSSGGGRSMISWRSQPPRSHRQEPARGLCGGMAPGCPCWININADRGGRALPQLFRHGRLIARYAYLTAPGAANTAVLGRPHPPLVAPRKIGAKPVARSCSVPSCSTLKGGVPEVTGLHQLPGLIHQLNRKDPTSCTTQGPSTLPPR